MSKFSNMATTKAGHNLLAAVHTGAVLIPTRIVLGSGYMPEGILVADMTDVISPVTELEISKARRTTDGTAIIGGRYSNADITEDFYYRELALFCRAERRDVNGNVTAELGECLYTYGNAGNNAELMPAYGDGQAVERLIDFAIFVGGDAQVSLAVASGIYVSVDDFNAYKAAIAQALADKANAIHDHDGERIKPSIVDIFPEAGSDDGAYIDFHYQRSADDFTTRLCETAKGTLSVGVPNNPSEFNPTRIKYNPILTTNNLLSLTKTLQFTNGVAEYTYYKKEVGNSVFVVASRDANTPDEVTAMAASYENYKIRIVTDSSVDGFVNVNLLIADF